VCWTATRLERLVVEATWLRTGARARAPAAAGTCALVSFGVPCSHKRVRAIFHRLTELW
jgi:hypothetical protein